MAPILDDQRVTVKIAGDFACFTRPDLKVERMSYPCPTASAARGILESILWKPEFQWRVRRIMILRPVRYASVKRNELNAKQDRTPLVVEERRAQRHSVILRDVAYVIEASVGQPVFDAKNPPIKYVEMFRRRVRRGQCFRRPFLGTREFAAEFSEPTAADAPIPDSFPVGSLFHDMVYTAQGQPQPLFARHMAVINGVLDCENASDAQGRLNERLLASSHLRPPLTGGVRELLSFYAAEETKEAGDAQ